jgi:hypothetical protein
VETASGTTQVGNCRAATLVGDGAEGDVGVIIGRSWRLRRRWSEAALVLGDCVGGGVGPSLRCCSEMTSKAVPTLVGVGASVSKSSRCWSQSRRGVMYVGILA